MTEPEAAILVAIIGAAISLVVAGLTHLSAQRNQSALEVLRARVDDELAENSALRDYRYDARKRLYQECGPILFQLSDASEAAFYRIIGLAQTAKEGNLEVGSSYLDTEYYRVSTIYRIFAPLSALKLLQASLTLVDLSLDPVIHRQYILARQAFLAFGAEFTFARLIKTLKYEPFGEKAKSAYKISQPIYYRQGLPLGIIQSVAEAIVAQDKKSIKTYAECESEYSKEGSPVRLAFDGISFLVSGFHPRRRPVFWRMLVALACLYRALSNSDELSADEWGLAGLEIPELFRSRLDWRFPKKDKAVTDDLIALPLAVAAEYFRTDLGPRLEKVKRSP